MFKPCNTFLVNLSLEWQASMFDVSMFDVSMFDCLDTIYTAPASAR
jgi:hypothetical protein